MKSRTFERSAAAGAGILGRIVPLSDEVTARAYEDTAIDAAVPQPAGQPAAGPDRSRAAVADAATIRPVILSGGQGTRLWPASRGCRPKQFLEFGSDGSLLQRTLSRVSGRPSFEKAIVVGGHDHRFLVADQARSAGVALESILLEPCPRDTAPAIAAAAAWAARGDPQALLLFMPSDHVIADMEGFADAIAAARQAALAGWMIVFGVRPTRPLAGFGYIEMSDTVVDADVCRVASFVEKPDAGRARAFVDGGRHLWNAGLVLARADTLLDEVRRYAPDIHAAALSAVANARHDLDFVRLDPAMLTDLTPISFDYAVLQSSECVGVARLPDVGWNDIGSWDALLEVGDGDGDGNVALGEARLTDCSRTFAYLPDGRLLVGIGLSDLVVVSTQDAMLVARRGASQDLKSAVERLRGERPDLVADAWRMYRPWGYYECLHRGERHQVKCISVKPGGTLSLQRHYHRSEHWVVVDGTARVTRGDEVLEVTENESVYLPLGTRHRLENPGRIPLRLIEVQTGSYLGEDDIERYEDVYGRD